MAETLNNAAKRFQKWLNDQSKKRAITMEESDLEDLIAEMDPDEAQASLNYLAAWATANPPKTYKDDFFEKFPNAQRNSNGFPVIWFTAIYSVPSAKRSECYGIDDDDRWAKPFGYWEE